MSLEENLSAWGCDVTGAMERLLDDHELYRSCLEQIVDDENFEKLGAALNGTDAEEVFQYAHTLKGVFANLGLTPLYNTACSIVEPVRSFDSSAIAGVKEFYPVLLKQREQLQDYLK